MASERLGSCFWPRLLWQFIRLNCPAPWCCYFYWPCRMLLHFLLPAVPLLLPHFG